MTDTIAILGTIAIMLGIAALCLILIVIIKDMLGL